MKKINLVLLVIISTFVLTACTKPPLVEDTSYLVTFNSNEGSVVADQEIIEGELAIRPTVPNKEGYVFVYWYETDDTIEYDFSTSVSADVSLNGLWEEEVYEMTDTDRINEDIAGFEAAMYLTEDSLDFAIRGSVYGSRIKWTVDSQYISEEGIILPLPLTETEMNGQITGEFTLNDTIITKTFDIPLTYVAPVEISNVRNIPFENLTTEYEVEDSDINIYFEEDGTVPYVKVVDFFTLLTGLIDPNIDFTVTVDSGILVISYQYYDEDEMETYDMILTIDSIENTVVVNDPAFYWAYVATTETNYGRHIEYDFNNPNASTDEGEDVIYDLDDYSMDIVVYEDTVVMPFYMANQLFAAASYFNVYYNNDGLFGIYSLPEDGSMEMRTIMRSSMNNEDIPADLLIHTFNMLAFDLDNLYGLQELMEVSTYYDLLYSQKDDLLVQDPEDFDYAIRELLLKSIDEPHTSYGYRSYFNKTTWDGPETNNLSYYGTRMVSWYYDGLFAVDDVLEAKWGRGNIDSNAWAATSPNRPNYWFLDDVSVVLSLDDFYTADIDESSVFDITYPENILDIDDASNILPVIAEGNKFFYYNNSEEHKNVLEILVKGVTSGYVDTYEDALVALGYEFIYEATTDDDKLNGYYKITVDTGDTENPTIDYMVQVTYDVEYQLFYVGIIDVVPDTYEGNWELIIDIDNSVNSDSAVYMEMMMDQIMAEAPNLENIVLDISWNTGGNVGALYRVVGFITDESFRVSHMDGDTGGSSSYYVTLDGIDAYDTLNWSLLVTPVSFSAANSLATMFMENDLGPIIGVQTGGGACSITPILLPNGTAFTMSSNNIGAYRTGTGTTEDPYVFHNTEFGITPDYEIEIELIYDTQTLLDIILSE